MKIPGAMKNTLIWRVEENEFIAKKSGDSRAQFNVARKVEWDFFLEDIYGFKHSLLFQYKFSIFNEEIRGELTTLVANIHGLI